MNILQPVTLCKRMIPGALRPKYPKGEGEGYRTLSTRTAPPAATIPASAPEEEN